MDIYLNFASGIAVNADGRRNAAVPVIAFGDQPEAAFQLLADDGTALELAAAESWQFVLDADRKSATVPLCITNPDSFTYDAAAKVLHFTIDAATAEFLAAVDGQSQLPLIAELYGFDASGRRIYRFTWSMYGIMPVLGGAGEVNPAASAYVTQGEFAARNSLLMLGLEGGEVTLSGGTAEIAFLPHQGEYWINAGSAAEVVVSPSTVNLDLTKSYYFDIKITSENAFALTLPAEWLLEPLSISPAAGGRYVLSVHYDAFAQQWNANLWQLASPEAEEEEETEETEEAGGVDYDKYIPTDPDTEF